MEKADTIIVGAGIAGLATALALGNRPALMLEKAKQFSEIGAGLQLGPNAVQALRKLGAWDAVTPITSSPPEVHIRDGMSGRLLNRIRWGKEFERRYGSPYLVAHRADLHAALLSVVRARRMIELKSNCPVTTIDKSPLDFQTLIAADGVNSNIRQLVFGHVAISIGHTHHRTLIEVPDAPSIAMDCVNLWLLPHGHVVHYPVGKTAKLNIVAVSPDHITATTLLATASPILRDVFVHAQSTMQPWPGLYVPTQSHWSHDNIHLIGDAAHGTVPYLAQGAAMALEDAASLAQHLGSKNLPSALQSMAIVRIHRTTRLHQASTSVGRTYHAAGALRMVRNAAMSMMPEAMLRRQLDWIYAYGLPQK